jgi:hypothetical protein
MEKPIVPLISNGQRGNLFWNVFLLILGRRDVTNTKRENLRPSL